MSASSIQSTAKDLLKVLSTVSIVWKRITSSKLLGAFSPVWLHTNAFGYRHHEGIRGSINQSINQSIILSNHNRHNALYASGRIVTRAQSTLPISIRQPFDQASC
jgi:hypothetical protein